MKQHRKHLVQGTYRHNGKVVRLIDRIGPEETARSVRAAQWAEAERRLEITPSE
jgi:hypothetical protein